MERGSTPVFSILLMYLKLKNWTPVIFFPFYVVSTVRLIVTRYLEFLLEHLCMFYVLHKTLHIMLNKGDMYRFK